MNKIEKVAQNIVAHLPMDAKKIVLGSTMLVSLMAGCGRVVDTNQPTTPAPTTTIETTVEPVVDEPVVEDEAVKPGETSDVTVTPAEESNLPEPTFVQTGDNAYTVYVDCPDNSNAPELQEVYNTYRDDAIYHASYGGVSENLINAILTVGQNNGDLRIIDFDAYKDYKFDSYDFHYNLDTPVALTDDINQYDGSVLTVTRDQYNTFDGQYQYAFSFIVNNAFETTNYNYTCALEALIQGPNNWNTLMQECIDATGLTAEEIYAKYDAAFVMSYDTLGLANPEFPNQVTSYISEPVTVKRQNDNGEYVDVTYNIEKVKTYGSK